MSAPLPGARPNSPSSLHGPVAWMAGNSVASNLLMGILLVGGLVMGLSIKQEVFPEFSMDTITVSVEYPGATPEEVESSVVLAVEQAVQGLDGVEEIRSTSVEGRGTVTIEAIRGADVTRLWQDVASEVDQIATFPEESKEPQVVIDSRLREVISFALYGDAGERSLRQMAERIRDELLLDSGITQVKLEGTREFEILIEISNSNLRRYGLTLDQVASIIAQASVEQGGGSVETVGGDILLRMDDKRYSAADYGAIPLITSPDGGVLLLEDVAEVKNGFEDSDTWATFNGSPAILIDVYRVGDQTPIQVSESARAVVDSLRDDLPPGLDMAVTRDSSEVFRQRAELLQKNALLGLGLVFLCLAMFLEIRLAFWVSLGIPISFLGSFLILPMTSFSLNMITMFAYIVTLGIVVDDAIVVGENVYHHRRQGETLFRAAVLGTREVAMPVTFSVLTNMVAFLPMFFVPGIMGKIFSAIPLVVVSVFFISLIESLFILPAHLSHRTPTFGLGRIIHLQQQFSHGFERFVRERYQPLLKRAVDNRYTVMALGLGLLIATGGYVASGRIGMELFPKVESDYSYVEATLPAGSPRASIAKVEQHLVQAARQVIDANGGDDLSTGIFSVVSENTIKIRTFLTDPETRPLGTTAFTNLWSEASGEIPGLDTISFESDRGGPGSGKTLSVQLSHRDKDMLEHAGEDLAAMLSDLDGVSDEDDGAARGKRQYDIRLTRLGKLSGLTSQEVARQIRSAFYGSVALRLQDNNNEVTVRVILPKDERSRESTLEDFVLIKPDGGEIPLRDAVVMMPGRSYTSISRTNGFRMLDVTANVTPQPKAEQVVSLLRSEILPELEAMYPGLKYVFSGKQADLRDSIGSLLRNLLLTLFVIYALLAIPFKSYIQPVIIITCIPFGIVGAVFGHLLMGYSLSVLSLFGIVALSGVVINDSLILVDFANRRARIGCDPMEAIVDAGVQRFRPILLTTLTTFGGLTPMIFETSRQARFLIPMALSLGFGILFATFLTLFLVPSFYLIVEDIKGLFGHKVCSDTAAEHV